MAIKILLIIAFTSSLLFNLLVGWSPAKGEPVIITGIKRTPSLFTKVDYPEVESHTFGDDETWYYDVALPRMYRSYRVNGLENDFSKAAIIKLISWMWMIIAAGYPAYSLYKRMLRSRTRD